MMGSKDIIECKLSQRAYEEERIFFFIPHCDYSRSQTEFQEVFEHISTFYSLLGHYPIYTVYFFQDKAMCCSDVFLSEKTKGQYTLHIPAQKTAATGKQAAGWMRGE